MSDLHFACTSCGKCCTTPPEMTVTEAIALGDVFVPSLVYKVARAPKEGNEVGLRDVFVEPEFAEMDRNAYVDAVLDTVKRTGVLVGNQPGWDIYITITARPWIYPRVGGCPALENKLCKIHDRRPYTCRTVPLSYEVPDAMLVPAFRAVVEKGKSLRGYECDTSNAAPTFLKDGKLLDAGYAKDRAAGLAAAEKERPLAERILSSRMLPPLTEILKASGGQSTLSVSFFGAAVEAKNEGLIDDAGLKRFCEQQIAILERDTQAAILRREKNEREWTTRFRSLLDAYQSIVKSIPASA